MIAFPIRGLIATPTRCREERFDIAVPSGSDLSVEKKEDGTWFATFSHVSCGVCVRGAPPNANPFRHRFSQLTVEGLEDRLAPAAMSWTGGGGNIIFENPLNWSPIVGPGGGLVWQVPGPADDATVNMTAQITITAPESVHSLTVNANNVMIQGAGSLTAVNLTFSSPGGMFATNADITVSGAFNWTDGSFGGSGNLNLNGTSTPSL